MSLDLFHPLVRQWFTNRFGQPTEPQLRGWPEIAAGKHTLIAAPTGSGKTLAAFLVCLDRLFRQWLEGKLPEGTEVVYVSPLKALSNDIQRNLQTPLAEISALAAQAGLGELPIRTAVRTGDTPQADRAKMLRNPPHILVTQQSDVESRKSKVEGQSTHSPDVRPSTFDLRPSIVNIGHARDLDLALEVPPTELAAVCTHEHWGEIYQQLTTLIQSHRSTLVFVNTRRLAERVAFRLTEQLGEEAVASHHGSL